MDINHILRLNLELEADIRLLILRDNEETRQLLIDKFNELSQAFAEFFEIQTVEPCTAKAQVAESAYTDISEAETDDAEEANAASEPAEVASAAETQLIEEDDSEPVTPILPEQTYPQTSDEEHEDAVDEPVNDEAMTETDTTDSVPPTFMGCITNEPTDRDETKPEKPSSETSGGINSADAHSLMKLFTINDKFRFMREIFNNDKQEFEATIAYIASFDSLDQVYDYLLNDLGWEVDNENVEDFISILSTHFNAK